MGDDGGPEPLGWDELLTRLVSRRAAEVRGDRLRLWWRPRQRLYMFGLAATIVALTAWVWVMPAEGSTSQEHIPGTVSAALLVGVVVRVAVLRRPILEIDGSGIVKGRLTVPWADVVMVRTRSFGRHAAVSVIVRPDSRAFDALPGPLRWLRLRGSRRGPMWGVVAPVADSRMLNLDAEEVRALFRHPANSGGVSVPGRPEWRQETSSVAHAPGVCVDDRALVVTDADGERLRIDDAGIHGRMPVQRRSVPWADIDRLGLADGCTHAALVLHLRPGATMEAIRERGWRGLSKPGEPALPIPLRGLPFDAVTLSGLVLSHPGGGAIWERGRSPE